MPSGITEAEMLYKQLANVGLPGAEKIKENIFAAAAGNLSEARRTTGNMTDYLEILNRAYTGAEDRAGGVDIQDATAKANNTAALAQFLSGVKAPAEQNIQDFNIQKNLDIQREKMVGTNNIFQTLESGVGAGIENYFKEMYLNNQKDTLDAMRASWGTGNGTPPPGTPPANPPATKTSSSFSPSTFGPVGGSGTGIPGLDKVTGQMDSTYQILKALHYI